MYHFRNTAFKYCYADILPAQSRSMLTGLYIFTAQQETVLISALAAAITKKTKNSSQMWIEFHLQATFDTGDATL